ncbi:unnamed protein product [Candida verbasci]|uniref:PPM-type phosphatase domain-containing protein n=1 Tax=Candida verbasci TaxID=1227364 RepID=A0A9W4X9P0_9ASCO|nr:unnamed protein product [Candida verbasci]
MSSVESTSYVNLIATPPITSNEITESPALPPLNSQSPSNLDLIPPPSSNSSASTTTPSSTTNSNSNSTTNSNSNSTTNSNSNSNISEDLNLNITPDLASQDNSTSSYSLSTEDETTAQNDPFHGLSFQVGVAENKNSMYRNKMEDVHTYIANFTERVDWGYFGIFDGHAGKDSARWCGNNLHLLLEQEIDLNESDNPDLPPENPITNSKDMKKDLYKSFIKADEMIEKSGQGSSGCTACVAVLRWEIDENENTQSTPASNSSSPITPPRNYSSNTKFDYIPQNNHKRMLYTSNVGDSRIILFREGKSYRLSYDHKASDTNEINRIENQGGLILKNRVNGVLAVTRSLGDTYMKDLVIGKPFTTSTEIRKDDEFIILACDGVWDVISDQKAGKFVSDLFRKGATPKEASQKLCQLALDNSTTDNITVMVVKFDNEIFS